MRGGRPDLRPGGVQVLGQDVFQARRPQIQRTGPRARRRLVAWECVRLATTKPLRVCSAWPVSVNEQAGIKFL